MKKLWMVLLSLALVAVFCMPAAAAVDVKWAGSYLITGSYESNRELRENGPSEAFYAQRLRFEPEFKIAEGLSLHTRIDTMTRVWGQFPVGAEAENPSSGNNPAAEQNILFRRGWVDFATPFGLFMVGYMDSGLFGLGTFGSFADVDSPTIAFVTKLGPVVIAAAVVQVIEGRLGGEGLAVPITPGSVDSDFDKDALGATYYAPWGEIGLLYVKYHDHAERPVGNFSINVDWIESHGKFTAGPFYAEYETVYEWGTALDFDSSLEKLGAKDVDSGAWEYYVMAKYTMGPAYLGFQYGHVPGDDPKTEDKNEGGVFTAGYGAWQPCLILYNYWQDKFAGPIGNDEVELTRTQNNLNLYQLFGGFSPSPKLALKASVTYVTADQTAENQDDSIGTEFDVQASYKIYDNLEYMVGFGYLSTGDYFKGVDSDAKIDDDYLIINQLTLSF